LLGGISLLGCKKEESLPAPSIPSGANDAVVQQIVASEELILALTKELKAFNASLKQNQLPGSARGLFLEEFAFVGLRGAAQAEHRHDSLSAAESSWAIPEESQKVRREASFWTEFFSQCAEATHGKVFFISGKFPDPDKKRFAAKMGAEWIGKATDGRQLGMTAKMDVEWLQESGERWRIAAWKTSDFHTTAAPRPFFREVLDTAVPDQELRQKLRVSDHHRVLMENYFGGKPGNLPPGFTDDRFFPDATNEHDGLSVVDFDQDGWDDLYLMPRWGRNVLLRNQRDGTFRDIAPDLGLDILGRCTCAIFADFDNDGDADCALGRSVEPSLFLRNEQGFFKPTQQLPALVTSMAAADWNRDGLLDLFIATYSPLDIMQRSNGVAGTGVPEWATKFLLPDLAQEVERRMKDWHGYIGQVGPPNLLLVNQGGKLTPAPEWRKMAGYRNSFAAAWCDPDADGDPDLYVANDFAPDEYYRNDGAAGFAEASAQAGLDHLGFGMGASWGDYDHDDRFDLYVTNMFSKAGQRITAQVPNLDQRLHGINEGNFLYHNDEAAKFSLTSGLAAPALLVAKAGWAWGGQWCDFDNDSWEDLYVPTGFWTAPEEVAEEVDL
jgi:hypothetical protein